MGKKTQEVLITPSGEDEIEPAKKVNKKQMKNKLKKENKEKKKLNATKRR
jgi:hypothetical protein